MRSGGTFAHAEVHGWSNRVEAHNRMPLGRVMNVCQSVTARVGIVDSYRVGPVIGLGEWLDWSLCGDAGPFGAPGRPLALVGRMAH